MSWKRILKKVGMDLDEADKACCEVARGELKQFFDKPIYKDEDAARAFGRIDGASCDELLERINNNIIILEELILNNISDPEPMPEGDLEEFWNPIVEVLEMIRDNWEDCKEGALKVKDDLKEKPEGFNPEEPYARQKDWWKEEKPVNMWSK